MPTILGHKVGPHGYGLMSLTTRKPPVPQDQAIAAMRASLENGMNFWNGGEFYGTPEENSMTLIVAYLEKYPEDRDKIVLSVKGAFDLSKMKADASPEGIRRSIDFVLQKLDGKKHLDTFECARRDPTVPLETTFGIIDKEYIQKGKISGISLSEVSAATIHEAAKITKIASVEVELSMFCTDVLTNGIAAACAQYDIPLVAYSPLGHGLLTGQIKSLADIPAGDFRLHAPRFQPGNLEVNLELVKKVEAFAARKGCTNAQLALGWITSLQRRPGMPTIIPIPSGSTADRVKENSKVVELTDDEMAEIDAILAKVEVAGDRYPPGIPINT